MTMQASKPAPSGSGSAQVNPVVSQLLVLADDSAQGPKSVADALEGLAWPTAGNFANRPGVSRMSLEHAQSLEDAESALAADSDARLIIVYQQPAATASGDLENGADELKPDAWTEQAEHLLDIYRRHRRQVMLVDGDAAVANPSGLEQQLLDRLGAVLHSNDLAAAEEPAVSVELVIADYAIRHDQKASRVLEELKASSLPISVQGGVDVGDLLAQWQQGPAPDEKTEAEAVDLPESESTETLKEENELLLLQLHQVQEELEHYFFVNKELEQEKAKLQEELEWKRADIENLHASMSWKLTAPLRKTLDLVSGGKK